jgi:hypothetical protein
MRGVQQMSNRLYLRYKCALLFKKEAPGSIVVDKSLKNYSFTVSKSGQHINMKLLQDGKTIEAESVVDSFKSNILQILRTNDYDKLSDGEKTELSGIKHPIREAVRQFAGLLKQELHRYDINDALISGKYYEWSLGDNQWFPIRRELRVEHELYSLDNLNAVTARNLQGLLSENEEALVATSYLHQARNSMNRRYQWIYATMAAELAIKEILVRIEPKLQVILGTLPSPPLNKLYGDVLESVAGVRSTNTSTLQKGAQKRNQLVHNPKNPTPTFDEVNEYIDFIEDRIKWLLKEWRRIKRMKKQQ